MSIWLPRASSAFVVRSANQLVRHRRRFPVQPRLRQAHSLYTRPFSSSPGSSSSEPEKSATPAVKEAPKGPLLPRVWKKVKHEAAHYWSGTKLLVSEVRISARLQRKILQGEPLTRRERRQVCQMVQLAAMH